MARLEPELLQSLMRGEPAAQAAFWRAQWPRVLQICRKTLDNPHDAADLAAEVLVDFMFERAPKLKEPEAAPSYVALMAMRRAQRVARMRRQITVPSDDFQNWGASGPGPDAQADASAQRTTLQG